MASRCLGACRSSSASSGCGSVKGFSPRNLRLSAEAAAARTESGEIATADERIAEALATLDRLAKIQKVAGQIRSSANTVDTEAGGLQADLVRLLSQARTALVGAAVEVHDHAA